MKKHYRRYFDEIGPDKEQKNRIYECIVKKHDLQNEVRVCKNKISARSVFSAAAATAAIGIAASFILINMPVNIKDGSNTTSESDAIRNNQKNDTQDNDSLLTIKNVFSNGEKLAVTYVLYFWKEIPDDITASIKTSINNISDNEKETITLKKSSNLFYCEKIYDISEIENEGSYKIKTELSELVTENGLRLDAEPAVSYTASANDCTNICKREKILFLGNTEHRSGNYLSDAFVEITPFETIVTLPGYENYNIELCDKKGNILKNIHDNVYEPMSTDTSLLAISAVNDDDRQYFCVCANGYRIYKYSGETDFITKNTVNALSVLNDYNGIYNFESNRHYTEISELYMSKEKNLVEVGACAYADSMFSSADGTDLSDKLTVLLSDIHYANLKSAQMINREYCDTAKEVTAALREAYPDKRFASFSVTYNIENKSDRSTDFYFYGGHPIMKSFTECYDDADIIIDNAFVVPSDRINSDTVYNLSAGDTTQITLIYIIPAESISVGFYIYAKNNDDFVLMDTK